MAHGDASERIRTRAWDKYIKPQIQKGFKQIVLPIKPLMKEMESEGFPPNHPRQFCKALQKKTFLQERGLILDHMEGPPSGTSTTVVLHFAIAQDHAPTPSEQLPETPAERAVRLTQKLRGLLKDELAEYGGAEGFMRWVRSDDDDAA